MEEIWKPVAGFEGSYEVSNLGRVRSLDRVVICEGPIKGKFPSRKKGRILRPGRSTPYGHVSVVLGRRNTRSVHVLVINAFKGPCPSGHEVLHNNCDATDNRLENLRYGTRSENNIDSARHGKRKLNIERVKLIRAFDPSDAQARELAAHYGVSRSQIWNVWAERHWKHV